MSTAPEQAPTSAGGNRWLILAGGVLVQLGGQFAARAGAGQQAAPDAIDVFADDGVVDVVGGLAQFGQLLEVVFAQPVPAQDGFDVRFSHGEPP